MRVCVDRTLRLGPGTATITGAMRDPYVGRKVTAPSCDGDDVVQFHIGLRHGGAANTAQPLVAFPNRRHREVLYSGIIQSRTPPVRGLDAHFTQRLYASLADDVLDLRFVRRPILVGDMPPCFAPNNKRNVPGRNAIPAGDSTAAFARRVTYSHVTDDRFRGVTR